MNPVKVLLQFAIAAALVGCGSTKFQEYRGSAISQGGGGTVRVVNGIDFWENGEPDRPFRTIGVIDDSRMTGIQSLSRDKNIASVAKEKGGDAVVLMDTQREARLINNGQIRHAQKTKVAVVKYAE